jgi:pSer/pThr/pTyr-binding forkhead associated (FHA) protein
VVTRDAKSGQYFIADLQSTNGVRVNGHQYAKVELRSGDYIDLGWLRLRFVAPEESFLFSRDVQVTPLPVRKQARANDKRPRSRRRGDSL